MQGQVDAGRGGGGARRLGGAPRPGARYSAFVGLWEPRAAEKRAFAPSPQCCWAVASPSSRRIKAQVRGARLRLEAGGGAGAAGGGAGATGGGGNAGGGAGELETLGGRFWRVAGPCAVALLYCNLCRICMSVAVMPAALELGWAPGVQGLVQSSFLWGYMATQLIGGTLADVLGGRRTMIASLVWFGAATALTPLAAGFPGVTAMMLARFLVGLGQGLTLPSMNSLVAGLPRTQRSRGLGVAFAGFHTGNITGLLLSPLILSVAGWRAIFVVFGGLALPTVLLWASVMPSAPRDSNTSKEASSGESGDRAQALRLLLAHPPTWAIIFANFVNHWGYFIYLGWMPSYFHTQLSLSVNSSSVLSLLPWAVMAVGSSVSGWVADGLIMKGVSVTQVRKILQTVSFLGPAGALLVLQSARSSVTVSIACFVAALGLQSLGQAAFVANMSDIAPKHAGSLFGLSNTFGSLAGIVGVAFAGFAVQATGTFDLVFQVSAILYVCGAALFLALASSERLETLQS